ncbi:HAMP domain-containing protein [Roseateles chitinivorans]|uniref:HAMP domain-containing protein n=1 Tax=Roseateles chitinivorans TaxID=2917965 RepID=UPI003D67FAA8
MKALYLRIYITVVVVLLAFALGSAWLFQGRIEQERGTFEQAASERLVALAVLVQRALPPVTASTDEQADAVEDWGQRLRMALALEDSRGRRIGASPLFERREDLPGSRVQRVPLDDGRHLLFLRLARPPGASGPTGQDKLEADARAASGPHRIQRERRDPFVDGPAPNDARTPIRREPRPEVEQMRQRMLDRLEQQRREDAANGSWLPGWIPRPSGEALAVLLAMLFIAVAVGAYPVVRRLTRRLESLKAGVEQFGSGDLSFRVQDNGKDEVAALATSFNLAAERIEALLRSQKSLLANASHELRSPLARLKMAFSMLDDASPRSARGWGRRSTPTSSSSTRWSRKCCWPAASKAARSR